MSGSISANHREIIKARDSISGLVSHITATNNKLDVNASVSISGTTLPISGATTGLGVAILDGSGNQITSFGGGTQYTQGGATVANPTGTAGIWFDGSGNPKATTLAQPLPIAPTPDGLAATSPTNATSTVYATNIVVKGSAGVLYGMTGYNSKTSKQFIQVHNTTSLPADTAVPIVVFSVAASSSWSLDWGDYGRYFSTGITICNSSTGPTKTIGSADTWWDVQYV